MHKNWLRLVLIINFVLFFMKFLQIILQIYQVFQSSRLVLVISNSTLTLVLNKGYFYTFLTGEVEKGLCTYYVMQKLAFLAPFLLPCPYNKICSRIKIIYLKLKKLLPAASPLLRYGISE